ncbi:double-strand break repair protein AddB [Ostreiculturibacter nitratireducens]|uniref:double-strand break repair protein AddB n=1 Tax=Ostreiculturibacter nitratireducens TaxID=3075226 RepID=UPI0031B603B0
MFERSDKPRLFALPSGADFPRLLVEGLLERAGAMPPEALARTTLYVNTRRMQRRVREVFDDFGARLLPRLRLVTDIGSDPLSGLPAPVPSLRRRLELAQLVRGLVERESDFAPGTAVFDLADSLADLMDEMHGEGVPPEALDRPSLAENHAAHWERSLKFIRIVARYFDADAAPDAQARQRRVIEALAARWLTSPPEDPVIVAGSTGSRGATALFLRAVAALPQGAVVLPGYDFDMPDAIWNSLDAGPSPAEDHPQYRFQRLVRDLGLSHGDVARWTGHEPPSPPRNRLLSLAFRPAPVTDQWMSEGPRLTGIAEATEGLTLIEAQDPRSEAVAIALALREAAETGARAALISPDRLLTRRVAAALDRWGVLPDDSAGQPLALSPPGRFLRHVAALAGRRVTMEALLTLLKHPLTATGSGERGPHLRFTRELELHLRRHGPAFPDHAALSAWAASRPEDGRAEWAEWLGRTLHGVEAAGEAPLADWVEAHLMRAEALAAGPGGTAEASGLWREAAGAEAFRVMSELRREAEHGGPYTPAGYGDLLASLLGAASARQAEIPHPTVAIWGTLEARVQGAELVILGGLNEGVWPEAPPPDPWLSRQMRQKAGLLLPERRIGLSAHDFEQAACAPRVILSRAVRDAEAQTVASRWLNRLTNLLDGLGANGGPEALEAMKDRGKHWLSLAAALETPTAEVPAAPRPAPRPPAAARPRELPVTEISRLIRDPYAVYAKRILRLRQLDPIRPEPDARERGTALHRIVEDFVRGHPDAETPEAARARLMAITDHVLSEEIPWPAARRLWRTRIEKIASAFVRTEAARLARGRPELLEDPGAVVLPEIGFTLTARPDRIDVLEDGRVHIYDYKSGKPPSEKQQRLFEKQLLLEAAMAERGGFKALGPSEVEGATYIRLGGEGEEEPVDVGQDTLNQAWEGLIRLIARYLSKEQGYTSRRAVANTRHEGDYDHLARCGEWETNTPPEPEDVG